MSGINVVVIGRNYTSRLGMIRALGMAGYGVIVIKTNGMPDSKDIDAYSKYVNKYLYAREPDRNALVKVLLSLQSDRNKTILIPVDDYAASTIDEYTDQLKDFFLFPNIEMKQGAVNQLMDKNYQKQIARNAGLNVAEGWIANSEEGKISIPEGIVYPVFPKPQISYRGSKNCMRRCDDKHQLETVLNHYAVNQLNCPILLEEYHEIINEYALLGFSDGNDVFFPAVIQMLESGKGPHHGVTLLGKVLDPYTFAGFLNLLKKLVRELHFKGLFDIDFYESKGVFFFNELNLRFGASGYAITKSGINLPHLFICSLLGKSYTLQNNIIDESVFVNEKVAYDDYNNGFISKSDYFEFIDRADITFIQSDVDADPYRVFLSEKFSYKLQMERLIRRYAKKFDFRKKVLNKIGK